MTERVNDSMSESDDSSEKISHRRFDAVMNKSQSSSEKDSDEENLNGKKSLKPSFKYIMIYLILGVSISVLVLVLLFVPERLISKPIIIKDDITLYNEQITEIRDGFKWPSILTWKMVNISLYKQIFKFNTVDKPSIIILVGKEKPVEMLYSKIFNIVNKFMKCRCPSFIPSVSIESDKLTEEINTFLVKQRSDGIRCIYMPHIDRIHPNLGPSLHSLTDELNAPYRDMIYLFSMITLDPDVHYKSDQQAESFMVNVLRKRWEDEMGEERFRALISRLGVNIVGVMPH